MTNPKLISDILFKKSQRVQLFLDQPVLKRIELLHLATPQVRRDLLLRVPLHDLAEIIETAAPDEAADFLQLLTKHRREKVMESISSEVKDSLSRLLEFDPQTAAGLMKLDYVQADVSENISDTAEKFKTHEKRTGRPPVILAMKEGKLAGFVPGHELGFAYPEEGIDKYVKKMPTISYAASHKDVSRLFHKHPHTKVAVMNDKNSVVGIMYSDDILRIMQKEESASLYNFAGIDQEESVTDSAGRKIQFRYKWLIINLATAFLAAFVVGQFEGVISQNVLLAVYMPIVAGMGGNAATQTLAVLVRGIALRQIRLRTAWRTLRNEVGAATVNGLINGFLVAFVVIAKDHDWKIAVILALAMVMNLIVAAVFGTLVPLIMERLKKDPAASATIFITTATDVLGFLTFLGLATIILK